jgi:hypothetical protein
MPRGFGTIVLVPNKLWETLESRTCEGFRRRWLLNRTTAPAGVRPMVG